MNKIIITLIVFFSFITTTYSQIRFAPEVGLNMGMSDEKTTTGALVNKESSDFYPGVKVGGIVDIPVVKHLYLQPGLFYTMNNIRFSGKMDFIQEGLGTADYKRTDVQHFVQLPVYILFKSGFEGMGRFVIGGGPYIGYAFAAQRKSSIPHMFQQNDKKGIDYLNTSRAMELGNDHLRDQLRNWDYGLNVSIGYESNVGLYFRGYGNYGLANLKPGGDSNNAIRNWAIGFSIGFLIGEDQW